MDVTLKPWHKVSFSISPALKPIRRSAVERLTIELKERSYPILIGSGLLHDTASIGSVIAAKQLLIVTNETVAPLYLQQVVDSCAGKKISTLVLPDGEVHKTLASISRILDALMDARANRDAAVIALGGGVIGDMAGFAASCYQRGVDFIQIPTTLLAQVDSSVGGKTGVNHPGGKNMIGAFHQPRAVITDLDTLRTLPDREFRAGLAELVKHAVIRDEKFFGWLEQHATEINAHDQSALTFAIRRSCEIKAEVVAIDEREHGLRAILNFGHTFGHAVETATGYSEILHGEAVSIGMVLAADLSLRLGWLNETDRSRMLALFEMLKLRATGPRIGTQRARELMGMDKKVLDGKLRLVLLKRLGEAIVTGDFPPAQLDATLQDAFG
jgi:3-dehydroquinate synthase